MIEFKCPYCACIVTSDKEEGFYHESCDHLLYIGYVYDGGDELVLRARFSITHKEYVPGKEIPTNSTKG